MNPLISIVLPTYNHANFLKNAIVSVIDQEYNNWELIVVDNHSTDNTDEVIFGFNDTRIKCFKIHNNGIIAASRNLGILKSKGDWIAFLDSDDLWYSNKLSIVVNEISSKNFDVICSNEYLNNKVTNKKYKLSYGPYVKNFYKDLLVNGNKLSPSSTLVRAEFIKKKSIIFNESIDFITVEDYDFWLNLANSKAHFYFINNILGEYIIHGNNNSTKLKIHRENLAKLIRFHLLYVQKFTLKPEQVWKKILPRIQFMEFYQILREENFIKAFKYYLYVILKSPVYSINFLIRYFIKKYKV